VGGDGEDSLWGGTGADTLLGGAGNDTISGFDPLKAGANAMFAGDGIDLLSGGEGDDRLLVGRGDLAVGGAGNDTFAMDTRWTDGSGQFVIDDFKRGADTLELTYSPSYDAVTGAEVVPKLTVALSPGGESSQIFMNGTAIATVNGVKDLAVSDIKLVASVYNDSNYDPSNYATESFGTNGNDTLNASGSTAYFAQGGNDKFTGSNLADYADVGIGNDSADMGAGNDSALGGEGTDSLTGGDGNDSLRGGNGKDTLRGDGGDDQVFGDAGDDTLAGGLGNDSLDGGAENDQLTGGFGADSLYGGAGNDTISGYENATSNPTGAGANEGKDMLYGGAGADNIWVGTGDSAYGGSENDVFMMDRNRLDAKDATSIEDFAFGDKIEIHYPKGTTAPVITLAATGVTGETNVLADGQVIAKVVSGALVLSLSYIKTVES
jgi:Ca2+-binding RTX toxin-like protein